MATTREGLQIILNIAAAQEGLKDIESPDQFIGLFANSLLLGTLPDASTAKLIKSYIQANLAGGDQLNEFTKKVIAKIPETEFERPVVSGKDIKLDDLIALARYAIEVKKWSFGKKRNPGENFPLAV